MSSISGHFIVRTIFLLAIFTAPIFTGGNYDTVRMSLDLIDDCYENKTVRNDSTNLFCNKISDPIIAGSNSNYNKLEQVLRRRYENISAKDKQEKERITRCFLDDSIDSVDCGDVTENEFLAITADHDNRRRDLTRRQQMRNRKFIAEMRQNIEIVEKCVDLKKDWIKSKDHICQAVTATVNASAEGNATQTQLRALYETIEIRDARDRAQIEQCFLYHRFDDTDEGEQCRLMRDGAHIRSPSMTTFRRQRFVQIWTNLQRRLAQCDNPKLPENEYSSVCEEMLRSMNLHNIGNWQVVRCALDDLWIDDRTDQCQSSRPLLNARMRMAEMLAANA